MIFYGIQSICCIISGSVAIARLFFSRLPASWFRVQERDSLKRFAINTHKAGLGWRISAAKDWTVWSKFAYPAYDWTYFGKSYLDPYRNKSYKLGIEETTCYSNYMSTAAYLLLPVGPLRVWIKIQPGERPHLWPKTQLFVVFLSARSHAQSQQ